MSELLFAHNINTVDFDDQDYEALYQQRRRDANFAGAIQHGNKIHAFRDHLGIIPLYFRYTDDGVQFALDMNSLVQPDDTLSRKGLAVFTKFATPRFASLFDQIHVVPPASVIEIDPTTQTHRIIYQYQYRPHTISNSATWDTLVNDFKALMIQALERTVQHQTVGLYLSGGIDSAIIAILLREMGVTVNGYTSGPWGKESSDIQYAKSNAEVIGIAKHEFDFLDTDNYEHLMESSLKLFQVPKGIPTTLGVTSLWDNTSIGDEQQLFCGQNCDNIMGSMTAQYLTLFLQPFPAAIRQRFHPAMTHSDMITNYLNLAKNYAHPYDTLNVLPMDQSMSRIEQLIVAAMATVGNSSSEVFTQPALMRDVAFSNPYHDVDVVEFTMGIPFRRRLDFSRRAGLPIPVLEKHLIQKLAGRYLPADVVKRKKAFTVSFDRDEESRRLYELLPAEFMGIPLQNENERFSGGMLTRWLQQVGWNGGSSL